MTASDKHDLPHAEGHSDESHGGNGKYIVVFFLLCGLTTLSFMTYFDFWRENDFLREWGWAFMMAVSCTKAMLVILIFMHLRWEANWKYILTLPATAMAVFLVCMLIPDIGRRAHYYNDYRWIFAADPSETEFHETEPVENESLHDDADHNVAE